MSKIYANRGIKRNKKPLQNIVYQIEILKKLKCRSLNESHYDQYKFKDEGYLVLNWQFEKQLRGWNLHGFITPEDLRKKIGDKQWSKFCQGKRIFTIQRRANGKNI